MTINERVSPERLAHIRASYEASRKGYAFIGHPSYNESVAIIDELQQYRAAAEKPVAVVDIQRGRKDGNKFAVVFTREGQALPDDIYYLHAAPQITRMPDDAFERALSVLNDTLDDCGDSERGLLLALDRMGIEVGEPTDDERLMEIEDVGSWANNRNTPTAAPAVQAEQQEPLSQPYTLPVDYLQGHKDGCEWAASMAEANHPQTGDWLYDDPIELAKAIRKGPDMLPAEPGNSPSIPDGWIPVSERMPGSRHAVLVGCWFGSEWTSKWATYVPGHPDAQDSGWLIPGASWTPTHWHELPAAPQQEAECCAASGAAHKYKLERIPSEFISGVEGGPTTEVMQCEYCGKIDNNYHEGTP